MQTDTYFILLGLILLFVFALMLIFYIFPALIIQSGCKYCPPKPQDDEHNIVEAII